MGWSDAARVAAALARKNAAKGREYHRLYKAANVQLRKSGGLMSKQLGVSNEVAGHRNIEHLKHGEFLKRKPDSHEVYKRGHYDHGSKSYSVTSTDDVNKEIFIKRGKKVFTGFTY